MRAKSSKQRCPALCSSANMFAEQPKIWMKELVVLNLLIPVII